MLAAMKLGAVVIPATTLLTRDDLADRFARGRIRHVVTSADAAVKFARIARRLHPHRRRRRGRGLAALRGRLRRRRHVHPGGGDARRRSAAALFHLGHHGEAEARPAQPPELSGRPPLDHVLDRPQARATFTSTSRRPAGPSMPGAASSRPGTPAPACSCSTSRASTRKGCSTPSPASASRPSARRRPYGACSCRRTSPHGRPVSASWSAPASRSIRRSSPG